MYSPEEHVLTQVLQVRPKSVSVKQPHTSSYYEAKDWKLGAGLWTRLGKGQLQSCVHKPAAFICVPAFIFFVYVFFFLFAVEKSEKVKIGFYWVLMNEAGSANPESENVSRAKPGRLPGRGVRECG